MFIQAEDQSKTTYPPRTDAAKYTQSIETLLHSLKGTTNTLATMWIFKGIFGVDFGQYIMVSMRTTYNRRLAQFHDAAIET
ncbi:hypothetical protein KIN20_028166 [Parelaphostrongylus tenuis]|uniref:Uncharacterized protein n=1 Tax=Parelaphostrongylus tenuis TaxID=148309 RepID=A0AAD5R0C3_PARTN|nr:hypothetical protein KIN20_028166 [Parelaphostrongylus tenuis]